MSNHRDDYSLADLLLAQEELEQEASATGEQLFMARVNKAIARGTYADAAPVRKLLSHGIADMEKALTIWLDKSTRTRGVRHTAVKWVEAVGVRESAYLALRVVLDGLLETRSEQVVARNIATLLQDELRFRRFREAAPMAFQSNMRAFAERGTNHYRHRASVLLRTAKLEGVDVSDLTMSTTEKIHVGYKLLDIVQHVCGLVESVRPYTMKGRKVVSERLLQPDPQVREWLDKRTGILSALTPLALPMVVPPIEWGHDQDGGYRFALRSRYGLVRKAHSDSTKTGQTDIPVVYAALNAAQGTPWRINHRIADVVAQLRVAQLDVPGYEDTELPKPAKPDNIDEDEQARKVYRRAAHDVFAQNKSRAQNARWLDSVMSVVDRMALFPAIYFPHSLDFRGRLYPLPAYLHPQGPDLCRSLLEFAEPVELGEQGARWLAIHLANTYGETPGGMKVSKMTLDERVQWAKANECNILDVAQDPRSNRWWQGAEEPWQCLAACLEYAQYMDEGPSFKSRIPVAIDGSCNGLQHLSAALRDERSGKAVNLTPSVMPNDVYTDVADVARDILAYILTADPDTLTAQQKKLLAMAQADDVGSRWLASGLIGRKASKRPTMTVAYGSRVFGFKDQIASWMSKEVDKAIIREHFTTMDDEGKTRKLIGPAAKLMASLLMEAMKDAISGPMQAMDWMQACAKVVTATGSYVEWTVPVTGWRVRQAYYNTKSRQVETVIAGHAIRPQIQEVTDKLDAVKQRNGIAPNIVHSLDAACLMLAVQMARAEGIEAFGLIHDSYACHAANMPVLARAARQAFVRLYAQPVLENLREQFAAQSDGEPLPEVPEQGALDLSGVLASDFFFA